MLSVLAIDPGPQQSAWIHLRAGEVMQHGLEPNHVVRDRCRKAHQWDIDGAAIEMIASYGMPVGEEVFATCVWIGRFEEVLASNGFNEMDIHFVKRQEVKSHLCKSAKANDASIRQALIDRYGPGKDKAIGSKAMPGPLYGIKADLWAALGVACTCADTREARY